MYCNVVIVIGSIISLIAFSSSCVSSAENSSSSASAHLESKGESKATGFAKFTHTDSGDVRLTIAIDSAEPGFHGIHIHENGDCSSDDGKSAGGHWNPDKNKHGDHDADAASHLGDLGNIEIHRDRTGHLSVLSKLWTIGSGKKTDVVGKAIVLHAAEDDFSDPAGNSGDRIACGVIEAN